MALLTFKGGVHPYDGKDLSKDKPILEILPKGNLVFPLSQHIGAPATPIVEKGDRVLVGQKIAEAGGFVSAPVYSSVSGTVVGIEPRLVCTGGTVNSIIVENDGKYEEAPAWDIKPVEELTREEKINLIKEAGIVGMGGAGFPTHVKLSPKEPEKIEYVIVNAAECEPYITADYRRMLECGDKLIAGLKISLSLFPNAKGIIAVEDNKMDCVNHLKDLAKDEPNIEVMALKTKYPQGAERQIIYATTGRAINSTMLPADAGCIVNNVESVISIYRAVAEGKPLINRVVTVTGQAIAEPKNFLAPIGMNSTELVEAAGGFKGEPAKLISGGPMMGFAMYSTDVPVTKTSSALLAFTEDEVAKYETTACINCGRCVSICPEVLIPSRLADYAENDNAQLFEKWNGLECIECGSCSYICPAKRHLAQSIKTMKKNVIASKRK